MTEPKLLEGANWGMTRRHYTTKMTSRRHTVGAHGRALCHSNNNPVQIYDQAYANAMAGTWGYNAKVIAQLPLCKRCAAKAEKLAGGEHQ